MHTHYHTHASTHAHTHMHAYIHACMHAYIHTYTHKSVPPVFRGKFYKIPQKYFMNSAADLSKFRSNSAEIILSFYINYK